MPRNTRHKVLDAARKLFAERGYEAVSVREICAEAGVSDNAIHYHFNNKISLYRAVLRRFTERQLTGVVRILAEGPRDEADFLARLRIFIEESIASAMEDPEGLRIAYMELERDWLRAGDEIFGATMDHSKALSRFFALAQRAGLMRATVDPDIVTGSLLDRIGGQVRHAAIYQKYWGVSIEDLAYRKHWIDQTVELLLFGILPSAKGGGG